MSGPRLSNVTKSRDTDLIPKARWSFQWDGGAAYTSGAGRTGRQRAIARVLPDLALAGAGERPGADLIHCLQPDPGRVDQRHRTEEGEAFRRRRACLHDRGLVDGGYEPMC